MSSGKQAKRLAFTASGAALGAAAAPARASAAAADEEQVDDSVSVSTRLNCRPTEIAYCHWLQLAVVFAKVWGSSYVQVHIMEPPVHNGDGLARAAIAELFTGMQDAPALRDVALFHVMSAVVIPTEAEELHSLAKFHPASPVHRNMHNQHFILVVKGKNELVSSVWKRAYFLYALSTPGTAFVCSAGGTAAIFLSGAGMRQPCRDGWHS